MCTVTYIPTREKYFISSNRDEKLDRKIAVAPDVYQLNGRKIIFPRDGDHGGSWIAFNENGNASVLLNGAFEKHVPSYPYARSRGKVFLEIISAESPVLYFHSISLSGIEPFTLVLVTRQHLYECRWNGVRKYFKKLNKGLPYIWSSVTLYEPSVIAKRENWFADFLHQKPDPTQNDILSFHQFAGEGDIQNNLLMQRDGIYSTVSITSMLLTADRGSMKYLDLANHAVMEKKLEFLAQPELI